MDARRLVIRYPVQFTLTAAAVLAVVRAGLLPARGGSAGTRIRVIALAVVLVGFAVVFWFRPAAERTGSD